jgi:aspartyl-tRNA(Asn)/glutamyl-tRNA(Gln) amidotransferase subunit C
MSSEKYPRKKPNILLISLRKRVLDCAIIQEIIFRFKRFFMSLSKEEVRRIAELARIGISDAEAQAVQAQLNDIFELIGKMQQVDTEGVEPMSHGQDLKLRLRDDVVTERDQRERFQSVAPKVEQGLYLVPKVIE